MAINQNHLFDELNGVKCAIVEKNSGAGRVDFLKKLLEANGFEVVVIPTPPPKTAAAPIAKPATAAEGGVATGGIPAPVSVATGETAAQNSIAPGEIAASGNSAVTPPAAPETFTVGVTDVGFNPTNAIFGRLLRTSDGHVVTMSYWQQKEKVSHDDIPYYESGV